MRNKIIHATMQEQFWQGDGGDQYHDRNPLSVERAEVFFRSIQHTSDAMETALIYVGSILEPGAGIGTNLAALKRIYPAASRTGIEINAKAHRCLIGNADEAILGSVPETELDQKFDLVLTKGWLIHIPPERIERAYQYLYEHTNRYILICEYFSPRLEPVPYHGETGLLWKGPYAYDLMDKYAMKLIGYGFWSSRDDYPQDDINWFLLEKK